MNTASCLKWSEHSPNKAEDCMVDLTNAEFWNNIRDDPMFESDKAH